MDAKEILMTLVELRRSKGIRQVDLAKTMGITQPVLSELETCKTNPRLDTIVKYAEALGHKMELVKDDERFE